MTQPINGPPGALACIQNYALSSCSNGSTIAQHYPSTNNNGIISFCNLPGDSTCPIDRNNNHLYSCFPASGDNQCQCRSSCMNGTDQDFNFTLDKPNTTAVLPIAERGIELYENYGLDQTIRTDNGNYFSTSDNDGYISCINENGRKVSIYGNVKLQIWGATPFGDFQMDLPKGTHQVMRQNAQQYAGQEVYTFQFLGDDNTGITSAVFDIIYIMTVYYEPGQTCNSGVVFEYDGRTIPFIDGYITPLTIAAGTDINHIPFVTNKPSCAAYARNTAENCIYYVFTSASVLPNSGTGIRYASNYYGLVNSKQQPNMGNCTTFGYQYTAAYMALYPCYGLYGGDAHFINCAGTKPVSNQPNCVFSGTRSMYIPPHMFVVYADNWESTLPDVNNSVSSPNFNSIGNTDHTSSYYSNGTFHSLVSTTSGSQGFKLSTNSDSIPRDCSCGSQVGSRSGSIDMNGLSLYKISCKLKTSASCPLTMQDTFFSTYINNSYTGAFAPEILLIPGIQNASTWLANSTTKNPIVNPIQAVTNPNQFWTDASLNTNQSFAAINTDYQPNQVFIQPGALPPSPTYNNGSQPGVITVDPTTGQPVCQTTTTPTAYKLRPIMMLPKRLKRQFTSSLAQVLKIPEIAREKQVKVVVPETGPTVFYPMGKEQGLYRIIQFEPTNGVYSIEWLYVLYYCCNMGCKNVTYTPGSAKPYNYVNGNTTKECLLYRDPYNTRAGASPQDSSRSDIFMNALCAGRKLIQIYANWQPSGYTFAADVCGCALSAQYCPTQFNQINCPQSISSSTSVNYVPDSAINNSCNQSEWQQYCSTVIIQANLAKSNGCNPSTFNPNQHNYNQSQSGCQTPTSTQNNSGGPNSSIGTNGDSSGGTSGGTSTSGGISGGTSGAPKQDPPPTTTTSHKKLYILIAIIVFIILTVLIIISIIYASKNVKK